MARSRQAAHNAPAVIPPQGRLTLTTATPVMVAEAAAQTTIYYTPYVGDRVALYNGTEWENKQFTELSIAMAGSANWASGSVYDLYVFNDAGTLRLVTGTAWTNTTTRAESLTRTNGIWLNTNSQTARYGAASTVTMGALRGTYVGTVHMSANGTTTWELGGAAAGGDPGRIFLWNCYNRALVALRVHDSTDSWTYTAATFQSSNASTSNRVTVVRGLNEDSVHAFHLVTAKGASGVTGAVTGICLDNTNASSGVGGQNSTSDLVALTCEYRGIPGLGVHFLQAVELNTSGGPTAATFYGDNGVTYMPSGITFEGMF